MKNFLEWKDLNKTIIWALTRENLPSVFVNNRGADQPVQMRSLISAFVIPSIESFIS